MKREDLIRTVLDCGAAKAALIDREQIVLSRHFRSMCESNQCGNFGRCWTCPPDIGDIHTLMAQVRRYSHGIWYQSVAQLEDSFDIEGMYEASRAHAALSRRIRDAVAPVLPDALHLTCGGCGFCTPCAKQKGDPCPYPTEAMSSLESYGIDVYNTTMHTDLKYINGENTVTYFGIVLFSE